MDDPEYANSDARTPWKPLRCGHRGPGRVAWTPFLMQAERQDGRPRQKLLHRFPTIRSCCVEDQFNRAAWWYEVEQTMHGWWEAEIPPMCEHLSRDRRAIVSKLRGVVPRPTRDGVARFTAYRVEKEAAFRDEWEQIYRDLFARHGRRVGGDAGGRASAGAGASTPGAGSRDSELESMGLAADATAEDLRRRFRELARECHPDAGGSEADFIRLKAVYDRLASSFRGSV